MWCCVVRVQGIKLLLQRGAARRQAAPQRAQLRCCCKRAALPEPPRLGAGVGASQGRGRRASRPPRVAVEAWLSLGEHPQDLIVTIDVEPAQKRGAAARV